MDWQIWWNLIVSLLNVLYIDNRLLNAFLVLHGVRTIIQIATSASSDKEVVTRSMWILTLLTTVQSAHRYVDLPITADFCVQVLNDFITAPTCVQLSLQVLQAMKSEGTLHRLESECHTFHKILLQNQAVAEVCESTMIIMPYYLTILIDLQSWWLHAVCSRLWRQKCSSSSLSIDLLLSMC